MDKESWLEAIKSSEYLTNAGAWFTLHYGDKTSEKFQTSTWAEKLKDEKFYNRVVELMEQEIVLKFDKREGKAADFYDVDNTEPEQYP